MTLVTKEIPSKPSSGGLRTPESRFQINQLLLNSALSFKVLCVAAVNNETGRAVPTPTPNLFEWAAQHLSSRISASIGHLAALPGRSKAGIVASDPTPDNFRPLNAPRIGNRRNRPSGGEIASEQVAVMLGRETPPSEELGKKEELRVRRVESTPAAFAA